MTKLALRAVRGKFIAAVADAVSENKNGDFLAVVVAWLLLAVTLTCLALPNTSVPGLNYDEAHCAGMARDFLTGHAHRHLPGYEVATIWGRPFPTFVVPYGGAIKSWLLLPSFALFGASQSVLRLTALGWGLVALLLFMLWTWRWLGRNTAVLAGVMLALDPNFFFICVLDWGPVLPSFLCRFACFYIAVRWWQITNEPPAPDQKEPDRKLTFRGLFYPFFAGLFAGLGFFNKVDFAVLLASVVLALLCCNVRPIWKYFVVRRSVNRQPPLSLLAASIALAGVGFFQGACLILPHVPSILQGAGAAGEPGELTEKFNAMFAMYDGSYFYRLIDAGGLFDQMYHAHPPVFAPIGLAMMVAGAWFVFRAVKGKSFGSFFGDAAGFLVLTILFITLGIFQTPRAARIHHMVLVYPFPHLLVALAATRLWHRRWVAGLFVLLVASQLFVLCRTQQFIRQTGGRGWWSDAISAFARQMKDRSDLTIVCLDWGFSEQLVFLTDGPKLTEPFWQMTIWDPKSTNCIYLGHPTEYRLFDFGPSYVEEARKAGLVVTDLHPWKDHQDHVAFYSFRLRKQ